MKRTPMKTRVRPTPLDRDALTRRSGGWCEMQLTGCEGRAYEAAHRIKRGMGGRKGEARVRNNTLSNVLHACHTCHAWCHARPEEAYELGLMLREGQDPLTEPAVRRGLLVLLDDAGNWREAFGC